MSGTPTSHDWQYIYTARSLFVEPEQRFLFELDRQSNPDLLRVAPDIPTQKVQERIAAWSSLVPLLMQRLELRARGMPHLAPPITPPSLLMEFSAVVYSATQKLGVGHDWYAIGRTLERFAAGDLHRDIPIPRGDQIVYHGTVEPDSFFIFFFAEFALAAMDNPACHADHAMWSSLLPHLVKMQRYFLARFPERKRIRDYREPRAPIDQAARAAIDREWATLPFDRATLERLMKQNLDLGGDAF